MQSIMLGLTSVPGVMGGMLSDERGNVIAHSFPAFFDQSAMNSVAELLHDNTIGLHDATGGARMFDFRYELGRIIVKALPGKFLAILCQPTVNIQLLYISLNVAIKKLEKVTIDTQLVQAAQLAAPLVHVNQPAPSLNRSAVVAPAYSDYRAVADAKGVLLACEIIQKTAGTYWDSMLDSGSINRTTALEVSNFLKTGAFKKLTITNRVTGEKKHIPVSVIEHDRDHAYDGKILITLALAEALHLKNGDHVRAEVVIAGGLFGWEGI